MFSKNTNLKIQELLEATTVIDGHCDILIPLTEKKLEISDRVQLPDLQSWNAPLELVNHPYMKFGFNPQTIHFGCAGQYDIPRWREGGVNTQLCAIYLSDEKLQTPIESGIEMLSTFHKALRENDELALCLTTEDIQKAKKLGKISWVLSFEGCEALGQDIDLLHLYHKLGLRVASLTHTRDNIFAEGCNNNSAQKGLSDLGRNLVKELMRLNIVVDLVHIGEVAFWDIIDLVDKPLILSHSTSTMFASSASRDPNLLNGLLPRPKLELPRDKEVLRAIVDKKGVLGMIWILYNDIEDALNDIETALDVMGPDHIGLGSDLYGHQLATPGLEDISKLPNLLGRLIERGHSDDFLIKFLGENYLRVFKTVWGA